MRSSLITPELIRKYSVAGPRYTSYPTAVEFTPAFSSDQWRAELAKLQAQPVSDDSSNYSLYFHIPFCRSLCLFCACHKIIMKDREGVSEYLAALERELAENQRILAKQVPVEQIHWGGGSPNFLTPAEIERLGKAIFRFFPNIVKDADISVELDPRTTTFEQLQMFRALGFNRISFGVQDFDATVQELINRVQSYESSQQLLENARALGFKSIGIDLIYGLPGQTDKSFAETVAKVKQLGPDRIALYGYAHVTWRTKVQNSLTVRGLPNPEERVQLFLHAFEQLSEYGYEYIGMDHFARPSDELALALVNGNLHRNFMGYSTHKGVNLIGMGASSISTIPTAFAQNIKDVEQYTHQVMQAGLAVDRGVVRSREDQLRSEVIESILCAGSISFADFSQRWQVSFADHFRDALTSLIPLAEDDLVVIDCDGLRVTERGRMFMRNIAMGFDQYLPKYRDVQQRTFSQSV